MGVRQRDCQVSSHKQPSGDFFSHYHCLPPTLFHQSTPILHKIDGLDLFGPQSGDTATQSSARERVQGTLQLEQIERGESWAVTLSKSLQLHWIRSNMKLYPKFHSNCLPPPAAKTNKKQVAYDMQLPFPVSDTQRREKESMVRHFVGPMLQ